jgi:NADH-quinone oxidoreductase subunit D
MSRLSAAINIFKKNVLNDRLIQFRFKEIGILKKEDAVSYGVVGPAARASGISIDVRKDNPYAAYDKTKWEMIVQDECDVFSRIKVRILEIFESINIIQQCLKKVPRGITDVKIKEVPVGEGIGMTEASDGELFHYVRSDGSNSPIRHKIRSASYMNIPAVHAILIGHDVSDAAVILASLDPCYCCAERLAVIDKG